MKRRMFLKNSAAATLDVTGIDTLPVTPSFEPYESLRFGVCADLHQNIMQDGPLRLRAFIEAMNAQRPDFIIQLGDFCVPHERNQVVVDI